MTDKPSTSPCGSKIADFKKAVKLQDWPYDNGDDPSFYASREFGGQLSWGVCRQDVRNNLRRGDIVVFFSFRRFKETGDSEYRLCAVATVGKKVSQTDIWHDRSLEIYRKHFNLLVRPSGPGRSDWEHFEPTLEGSRVHHDWLWRIADHRGFRKEDFKKLQESERLEPGASIRNRPVIVAKNYVLFSVDPLKTFVLPKPPIIAWHSNGEAAEKWNRDRFSQTIKRLTLDVAERANGRWRSLRIKNSQRAHRHIAFKLPCEDAQRWLAELLGVMRDR